MRARVILPRDCTQRVPAQWVAGPVTEEDGFLVVPVSIDVRPDDMSELVSLLEFLANVDREWVRKHPGTPTLYQSGVTYAREDKGKNDYLSWPAMLVRRRADCEDLSAKRVQELRDGPDPEARFDVYFVSPRLIHIRVRRSGGRIEDPSKMVGM